jgi:hypothetical protein
MENWYYNNVYCDFCGANDHYNYDCEYLVHSTYNQYWEDASTFDQGYQVEPQFSKDEKMSLVEEAFIAFTQREIEHDKEAEERERKRNERFQKLEDQMNLVMQVVNERALHDQAIHIEDDHSEHLCDTTEQETHDSTMSFEVSAKCEVSSSNPACISSPCSFDALNSVYVNNDCILVENSSQTLVEPNPPIYP